jgi:hypothetical protein
VGSLWGDETHGQGLAFSPGGQLYAITPVSSTEGSLFTIDLDDAEMHLVGGLHGLHQSIAFMPGGRLFAVSENGFGELDPGTGQVIGTVYAVSGDYRGLELVPEPATLGLLALTGWALLRRRRGPVTASRPG